MIAVQFLRWARQLALPHVPAITEQLAAIEHRAVRNGCLKVLAALAPGLVADTKDDGKRSYFLIELSIDPGGARKDLVHVVASAAEVRAIVEADLIEDAYLAVGYGETVLLKEFVSGKLQRTIDLHPHIRLSFPDCELTFAGTGGHAKVVGFDPGRDFMQFAEALAEGTIRCQGVVVDWNAMALGPLDGRPVARSEKIWIQRRKQKVALHYGRNDLENGD